MLLLYSRISEQIHKYVIDNFLHDFDVEFQNKIVKYKRWQDVQLSLIGRILLKKGLSILNGSESDCQVTYSINRKPCLVDYPIDFNISHSGEIVACILSESGTVGIDIEQIHHLCIKDFHCEMTDNEKEQISTSQNPQESFFTYWTQKEAIIKSYGKGLLTPLNSFEVHNGSAYIGEQSYYLKEIHIDDNYKCHIASVSDIRNSVIDVRFIAIGY